VTGGESGQNAFTASQKKKQQKNTEVKAVIDSRTAKKKQRTVPGE